MKIDSKRISVIGAGLMGHGIAFVLAAAGHEVQVFDRVDKQLASLPKRWQALVDLLGDDTDALSRLHVVDDLSQAVSDADFVIEAAAENLEIKQFIVAELEACVSPSTIITSNTSAIPITSIAAKAFRPERIVGTHFWNPPYLVKLVEVVQADYSSAEAINDTIQLLSAAGYHAVHVKKDIPGFIGNRLQHALKREAIALVANGVCDAKTVDDVVKHGFGRRMGVLGPLEQSDLVGLDLTQSIHDTLMPELDCTNVSHPYLRQRVADGHLGMATGEGFRTWTPEEAALLRQQLNEFLLEQIKNTNTKNDTNT